MQRMITFAFLVLAVTAALASCQKDPEPKRTADSAATTTAQVDPAETTEPAAPDSPLANDSFAQSQVDEITAQLAQPPQPLRDFSYTPFGAEDAVKISSQGGKPFMVNFWAVWCEPCKMELPDFQEVYTQHQGEFEIIGLCVDKQRDPEGFVKSQGYTWQFGFDGNGAEVYQIGGIPRTLFVNKDGQVAIDFTGALTRPALEAALKGIL